MRHTAWDAMISLVLVKCFFMADYWPPMMLGECFALVHYVNFCVYGCSWVIMLISNPCKKIQQPEAIEINPRPAGSQQMQKMFFLFSRALKSRWRLCLSICPRLSGKFGLTFQLVPVPAFPKRLVEGEQLERFKILESFEKVTPTTYSLSKKTFNHETLIGVAMFRMIQNSHIPWYGSTLTGDCIQCMAGWLVNEWIDG